MYQAASERICVCVRRHFDTFRRHRIGLILPIVLALIVSTWYATSIAPTYKSVISLWFDTAVPNASSVESPQGYATPASNGEAVLQELFTSQQFLISVAHRGPLASFLASYHPAEKGPSALISKVLGRGSAGSVPLDNEIVTFLSHAFSVSTAGPQVVDVTMTSPVAGIEAGTLDAVAAEYQSNVGADLATRDQASITYYQGRLESSKSDLATANDAVAGYVAAHPGASGTGDPVYIQLLQAASAAQAEYAQVQSQLQSAQLSLQNNKSTASFRVLDPASAPLKQSSKKKMIFDVVAGLVAGAVISLLALNALAAMDNMARRPEDLNGIAGMEVVATIRALPKRRPKALAEAESS